MLYLICLIEKKITKETVWVHLVRYVATNKETYSYKFSYRVYVSAINVNNTLTEQRLCQRYRNRMGTFGYRMETSG